MTEKMKIMIGVAMMLTGFGLMAMLILEVIL